MGNLIRSCIYQAKHNFRDKGFLFWSLLYPIIMMTFFTVAFSGVMDFELDDVRIGIESDNPIASSLETIDFVDLKAMTEDMSESSLLEGEIDGFIDGDLNVSVAETGISQTIIGEIVSQIVQVQALGRPYESYDFSVDYIVGKNQSSNQLIVMFYSLIAMVAAYSVYPGVESVNLIQANLSDIGARMNVSPLKKQNFLFAGFIVAMALNIGSNVILLLFTKYVLKMELFYDLKNSLLLLLMGNVFGTSLGIFVGASNRKSLNFKVAICIASTLFMAALSGLLGPWLKTIVNQNFPLVSKLNPIAIVADNLYRVNFLENTSGVLSGTAVLGLYSAVFLALSFTLLRRGKYDSI